MTPWRTPIIKALLLDEASPGYPPDYLVARVRGRRARLVRDWSPLLTAGPRPAASEEDSWGGLLRELDWLHRQMDRRLRDSFAPMFGLFELKTIVLCLRQKAVDNSSAITALLGPSLLSESIKALLRGPDDTRSTIANLVDALTRVGGGFANLDAAYEQSGMRGFENGLLRAFLEQASGEKRHPRVENFFANFVDLRNVIILHKHLRWNMGEPAPFVEGGGVERDRLAGILRERSQPDFDRLLTELTGLSAVPAVGDEAGLETILLRSVTKELRKLSREDEAEGLILDYLWRIYVQARNLAVLHYGVGLSAQRLEAELIV
jgi:vacuolar-type H+-ATPase subunit C/Vma6